MSTITKQAVQAVADLKVGYTLGHADVAILNELARIALASLEAEPVALRDERSGSGGISKKPGFNDLPHGTPLYAATPAPVSLDAGDKLSNFIASQELLGKDFEKVLSENIEGLYVPGNSVPPAPVAMKDHQVRELVNDLRDIAIEYHGTQRLRERIARTVRAAMLQGADSNSPVIPDGWVMVPKEPTEHMIVEGFESEPDEFFSDEEVWNAYDAMSGCQQAAHRARLCWAAMIAAAPQQEAKNV
ncbi:hypothetical protein [Enterobacter asburiae]